MSLLGSQIYFFLATSRDFQTQRVKPDKARDGAINHFRRRGDAEAMDERGGHKLFQPQIEHR